MTVFNDNKINFDLINCVINKLTSLNFCEVYNMSDMNVMLSDPVFKNRNRTKREVEEESDDRLKHSQVIFDTFGQVRDHLGRVDVNGVYKYRLSHSAKVPKYGRLYDPLFRLVAYIQNKVRSLGLKGMVEIDQKNCHPRRFVDLYTETFGAEPPAAKELVEKKKESVEKILRYYDLNDNDECRDLVKSVVLAITMGGSISSVFSCEPKHGSKKHVRKKRKTRWEKFKYKFQTPAGDWDEMKFLADYKDEVRKLMDQMERNYPDVFKAVHKEGIGAHKHKCRTLSYVLQSMETYISSVAVLYMIDNGLISEVDDAYRMSFLHDGFYVLDTPGIDDKLLGRLAAHVKKETGLVVEFGLKRVDPQFTDEEKAALKNKVNAGFSHEQTMDKMWGLAKQVFTFPVDTTPDRLTEGTSLLVTNNGYEIAVVQCGVGCVRVDIRIGEVFFQSKFLYEVDTIDNDRVAREDFVKTLAKDVYGEDAVVDVQIAHTKKEYIKIRKRMDGRWVDMDFAKLLDRDPDTLSTIFIKGSMGGGKTFLVLTKIVGPTLNNRGSALCVTPNKSLVDSILAESYRLKVPLTSYRGSKRVRLRCWSDSPAAKRPRIAEAFDRARPAASVAGPLSGDVASGSYSEGPRDWRALVTTFDSLGKKGKTPDEDVWDPDVTFLDETSKVNLQIASGTMDKRPRARINNLNRYKTVMECSKLVICTDADLKHEDVAFVKRLREASGGEPSSTKILYHNSAYRLDARFVSNGQQLKGNIIRSIVVEKKNTVVPCSTNAFTKRCVELVENYAQGRVDLFANNTDRTPQQVIDELARIHQCNSEEATRLLECALNGCHYICGDSTAEMKARKNMLLRQTLAVKHQRKERWSYRDDQWVKVPLPKLEEFDTVLLVYSPAITVGVSFETTHFTAAFAMFDRVSQQVDTLLQMLRRFRTIFMVHIYLGSCTHRYASFEERLEVARRVTVEHHGGAAVPMDPDLEEVYRREDNLMRNQSGSKHKLMKAMATAIYESNAFNVIRHVPELPAGIQGSDSGDESCLPDESVEAMVAAKVLKSQSELSGAAPWESGKFNMLNRWFPDDQLPETFSDNTVRELLKYNNEYNFMRLALGFKESSVSKMEIENLTGPMPGDVQDLFKLLSSLGFADFDHFLKWCSAAAAKAGRKSKDVQECLKLAEDGFKFYPRVVAHVRDRFCLSFDKVKNEPVVQTVRCAVAIIKKYSPRLAAEKEKPTRKTIYGAKTECFFTTNEEFRSFFDKVMYGEDPGTVPPPPRIRRNNGTDSKEPGGQRKDYIFRSYPGAVLNYKYFT